MDKREISTIFEEIGLLLEMKVESPFKSRAYYNAARTIEMLTEDISELVASGGIREVRGIGEALAGKLAELVGTGRLGYYEELKRSVPEGLLEMTAVPGLGPKKIAAVWNQLGITTVGELEYACIENRLVGLPGFGQKTQDKIRQGIQQLKRRRGFHLYATVIGDAERLVGAIRHATGVRRAELAGELRRRLEIVRTISVLADSEEALYAALGLPYIEPELREGLGEIEAAEAGRLKPLVEAGHIQGVFHNHTTYSDGSASLDEMVAAARALGYRYIGISDHSQSAFYANGLKEDRIREQHAAIDALQQKFSDIRIFKGIEADILVDGAMDYPDDVLASFDFVIASVHSRFNLSEEDQTRRICLALANPYVTMLGHATGRLLLSREGYRVDMRKVIETAAAHGKIVEINANPHRLDLDWRLCRYAKARGVRVSINPDAHATEGLEDVPFGVNVARKGGLEPSDVVNTLGPEEILPALKLRR